MLDALLYGRKKMTMIDPEDALPGRPAPTYRVPERHEVLGTPLQGPFPANLETAIFGLGCFWGAERLFWELPGVYSTAAAYAGGYTPNPTYEEVCSGKTGHTEVVQVVYDPARISYDDLLKVFWEAHDPTQGMRQGNDTGTQYRSAIYTTSEQQQAKAEKGREAYDSALKSAGFGSVTTEIAPVGPIYLAEDYHQQYLHKVPNGYCHMTATGVACPAFGAGLVRQESQAAG